MAILVTIISLALKLFQITLILFVLFYLGLLAWRWWFENQRVSRLHPRLRWLKEKTQLRDHLERYGLSSGVASIALGAIIILLASGAWELTILLISTFMAVLTGIADLNAMLVLQASLMGVLSIMMTAIFMQIVLSWLNVGSEKIHNFLAFLTNPILIPLRRALPPMNGMDFAPMLAIFILSAAQKILSLLF